jgi:hypothetical protein
MYALVALLVVLVVLGGGGAYLLTHTHRPPASANAQPTATATATPIPLRTITDDTAKVRFAIPLAWTTKGGVTASTDFVCDSPDQKSSIVVARVPVPPGASYNLADSAKSFLVGVAKNQPVNYEQGPTPLTLAGADWIQEIGSFTANNQQLRVEVLLTDRLLDGGTTIYVLGFASTADTFATVQAHEFRAVEQSFAFLP